MKNKMRILAMICAGLLVVGCENQSSTENKTEEHAAAQTESNQAPAAANEQPAAPAASAAQPTGTETQAVIDPALGAPAALSTTTAELNAGPGANMMVPVTVKNTSQVTFVAKKDLTSTDNEVDFVIDFLDKDGKTAARAVMPLPDSLASGQAGTYQLPVTAPAMAGKYTLQVDMVQQGKAFFKDIGTKPVAIPVTVK